MNSNSCLCRTVLALFPKGAPPMSWMMVKRFKRLRRGVF
jgi:hypothetical protein